jgi:transcription antitermination protein NusB
MSRHRSRHRAVQILYQCDLRRIDPDEGIRNYYSGLYSEEPDDLEQRPEPDEFMEELVRGTTEKLAEIDSRIERHSENWRVERMPVVDRNVLRLAIYELLTAKLPVPVIIDEALELARKFSGREAVSFLNGVLDAVRKDLPASS